MLTPVQQLDDPYYLYLSNFLRQNCLDRKYTCIPLESRGEGFLAPEEKLDGVVAIGLFTPAQIDSLAALSPNLVFLDSSPFESRFDSVVLGYELGISLALDHLTELGHTRIGFIGPVYKLDDRRQRALEVRHQLFERQAEQRGLLDLGLMLDCPMEAQGRRQGGGGAFILWSGPPYRFLVRQRGGRCGRPPGFAGGRSVCSRRPVGCVLQ